MATVSLQNQGHPREDWDVMLKYMFAQDVVEKKLTNLAHIYVKQNKADLMTKCHTSEVHKKGCAMMGLRLA